MIVGGIIIMILGGIGFIWSAPKMDTIRSGLGQLAIGLGGQNAASEAQIYQMTYYGAIVLMILGIVLLIAGLVMRTQKQK